MDVENEMACFQMTDLGHFTSRSTAAIYPPGEFEIHIAVKAPHTRTDGLINPSDNSPS